MIQIVTEDQEALSLRYEGIARADVLASAGAWSVRYGERTGCIDHIICYFGLLPSGIGTGWLWADFIERPRSVALIRAGRRAFEEFFASRPWTLYAHCLHGKPAHFASFMGFRMHGLTQDGAIIVVREK